MNFAHRKKKREREIDSLRSWEHERGMMMMVINNFLIIAVNIQWY
jgi:hypothetical protein